MRYVKIKRREKISTCNLCQQQKTLSWDHVPPKGGIELTKVEMEVLFGKMSDGAKKEFYPKESQNGVKYRTICSECNAFLGSEYDEILNDFARSCGRYLKTSLKLPTTVKHKVKPQRLLKAILGHLVAAKIEIDETEFDQAAREYVLNIDAPLPTGLHVFYWMYPYDCSITIRDFVMFTPRGTFNESTVFQTLKYFPVAYLCCNQEEYAGLESLSRYGACRLDEEVDLPITLKRVEDPYWPESPSDEDNNIVIVGQSALNSIYAMPRR